MRVNSQRVHTFSKVLSSIVALHSIHTRALTYQHFRSRHPDVLRLRRVRRYVRLEYLNLYELLSFLPAHEPLPLAASSRHFSVVCKLRAGRYTCGRLTWHNREIRCPRRSRLKHPSSDRSGGAVSSIFT